MILVWKLLKSVPFLPLAVFFIGQVSTPSTVLSGEPDFEPPARWALLIGISQYQNERLPPLPGSRNDIQVIYQVLTTRFGFSPQNTKVLVDQSATRKEILTTLRSMVRKAKSNDFIYIHYSGHGSQVKDFNHDEQDQLDETIVPYDGRTKGIPDITDDELEQIFSRLNTEEAVIVLDSCHSGTATRGVEIRTRAIPPDTRLDLYRHLGTHRREVTPLFSERYVLMTGAAAHEQALDGSVNGKYHGLFSYSLFRTFGIMAPQTSIQTVFQQTNVRLRKMKRQLGRRRMPHPQLEAPSHRLDNPFFPPVLALQDQEKQTVPISQSYWASVQSITGDRVLLEIKDDVQGLIGSEWKLHIPRIPTSPQEKTSAIATARHKWPHGVLAEVTPPGTLIPPGTLAVMIAPGPTLDQVPVLLRSVPPNFQDNLKKSLRQHESEVQIVKTGEFARYVMDIEGNTMHIFSAEGTEKLTSFPYSNEVIQTDRFLSTLNRLDGITELFALENSDSQISLQARIVKVDDYAQRIEIKDMADPAFQIKKEGSDRTILNSLQLEIQTDQDSFLTIADVNAEGNIKLLFPNDHQNKKFHPEGFMEGGMPFLVPDSLVSPNRAGFYFDITGPPGLDSIRIFVNTDLNTAQMIRQYVQRLGMNQVTHTQESSMHSPRVRSSLRELRAELIKGMTNRIIVAGSPSVWSSTKKWGSPSNAADLPNLSFSSPQLGKSGSAPMAEPSTYNGSGNGLLDQLPAWTATSVFFKTTR